LQTWEDGTVPGLFYEGRIKAAAPDRRALCQSLAHTGLGAGHRVCGTGGP